MSVQAPAATGAFFGHMGVAIALGMASNTYSIDNYVIRLGCSLWHSKIWYRHRINGCFEARHDHEVHSTHYHGWYPRHLWSYSRCYLTVEK